MPCHREVLKRSHVDKTIVLLKIDNKYVPIVESAIKIIEEEPEDELANTSAEVKETTSLPPNLGQDQTSSVLKDPLNVTQGPQSLTNFKLQQHKRKKSTESNQSSSQKSEEAASTLAAASAPENTDQSKEVTEEEEDDDDDKKSQLEQ